MSAQGSNRGRYERLCHARLACATLCRGCSALGYGWQNQRKALKGRNKWRTSQTPIRKPAQATTRTNAEQRHGGSSIAPRCAARRETAASVRGACRALSGLLKKFGLVTQGGAIARKTRGCFPGLSCYGPFGAKRRGQYLAVSSHGAARSRQRVLDAVILRGEVTRGSVSRWASTALPNGACAQVAVCSLFKATPSGFACRQPSRPRGAQRSFQSRPPGYPAC
jgi:hypothetical protein